MKKIILIAVICAICSQAYSQSWNLTGNSGTNGNNNFIGTTDNVGFKIRTNNTVRVTVNGTGKVGIGISSPVFKLDVKGGSINTDSLYRIGGKAVLSIKGNGNTFAGVGSGYFNTGSFNCAFGKDALYANTTGIANTAAGFAALNANVTGASNTAIGFSTLFNNLDSNNTACGRAALYSNTTGQDNTAFGFEALYNSDVSSQNTAVGSKALYNSTNGSNTAVGYMALYFSTSTNNTAVGRFALSTNDFGAFNTAVGESAMQFSASSQGNTAIGAYALQNSSGFDNTASGAYALLFNSSGDRNIANGFGSLENNTVGDDNSAIGYHALYENITGNKNTACGAYAGNQFTDNSNNTFLGYNTDVNNPTLSNCIAIGGNGNLSISASNTIRFGNSSITSIGGQVGFTTVSDMRIKTEVRENVPGLTFINKLRPVTYIYDKDKEDELMGFTDSADYASKYAIEKIRFTGFLAQEVEKAAMELGYDFSGVDKPKSEKDLYGLRYAEFVVPLVKAVQELNEENKELKSEVRSQKSEMEMIKSVLSEEQQQKLKSLQNTKSPHVVDSEGILFQNAPNPFKETTTIGFYISSNSGKALLQLFSMNGEEIKSFIISSKGKGQIEIAGNTLAPGVYTYVLIVDDKTVDTKQMVVTK